MPSGDGSASSQDSEPPAAEVLQWARETLRGINVLTGYGRGPYGGSAISLSSDVATFLYRIERDLIQFMDEYAPKDPEQWARAADASSFLGALAQ